MSEAIFHWFRNKSEDLSNTNEDKKPILIELKSGLSALDGASLQALVRAVPVNPIFDCLSSQSSEEIEITSELLFILLDVLSTEEILVSYGQQIEQGLAHPSSLVKRSFLKLLQKHVSVESILFLSTHQPGILNCIIECLPCPDRSIAEGAVQFFKKIGKCNHGVQILYAPEFVRVLQRVMAANDISRFRVYEIVVDVAVSTPEGLLSGHNSGILPSLLSELKSADTLIQLNALELLTCLTSDKGGLLYLQREGVIEYLVGRVLKIQEEPLSFILLPGLIEFFGNLYKLQPTVFSQQHPDVLSLLFQSFETVDPALLGVVISTVGKIGFTDEGKKVLACNDEKVLPFFKKLGQLLQRKDELAVTAMNSLAVLMKSDDLTLSEDILAWFDSLGPQALQVIIDTAKLPFLELRLSALELMLAISSQDWGTRQLLKSPGLIEFLLDRNAEFDKHCKNIKYDTIKSLVLSPVTTSTISGEVILKLKQFLIDGPFYVATEPEMAFESAS